MNGPLLVKAAIATGVLGGAYSLLEARLPRLVRHRLDVAPAAPALTVLHVSDTHLYRARRRLADWLVRLGASLEDEIDLTIATGDFLSDDSGIDEAVRALGALPARLGRYYVLGSHDYYQAKFQSYAKYFRSKRDGFRATHANTARLEAGLKDDGWVGLTNATELVEAPGGTIRLTGMDDPYLDRHDTSHVTRDESDAFAIGVVHTPSVVSNFVLAGFDLVLAGHTHGGQVRFPFVGAAVTNSSLPAALAAGPHRIGRGWLHVSPGLGTSKFAPIRFNCPPEATILELAPRLI